MVVAFRKIYKLRIICDVAAAARVGQGAGTGKYTPSGIRIIYSA
jgi:hypothetical protein